MIYIKDNKNYILDQLKIYPNDYDLRLKLGLIKVNQKDYKIAKEEFESLILINKQRYESYLNLSNIFVINNELIKAENILIKYLHEIQHNKEIVSALAILYYNSKSTVKLGKLIKKYIDVENNHNIFFLKGLLLEKNNEVAKSIEWIEKSILVNKNYWPAYEHLIGILEKTNNLIKLEKIIIKSKSIFKNEIKIFYFEALYQFRINHYEYALNILSSNNLEDGFKKISNLLYLSNYYDLLNKIYIKLKKYNLSLDYALKRNKVLLNLEENKKFDKKILLEIITKYQNFYINKKNFIDIKNNFGLPHSNLVFLIGFPRSGTTLLDTILRSHSKTIVLEEKPYLINLRHKFFEKKLLNEILEISEREIIDLQKEYFESFEHSNNKIIIDKFPLNLIETGFIKKVFPNSKIVLALRHPLDSILSCVLTSFKINEAMANYENLETTANFYNEVFKLFKIYEKKFNIKYHSIKYEDVVLNFHEEIKKLLFFLNLDYEKSIDYFHLTAKKRDRINTPSYDQVIQPIYKDSINRHKNFIKVNKIKHVVDNWIKLFAY